MDDSDNPSSMPALGAEDDDYKYRAERASFDSGI